MIKLFCTYDNTVISSCRPVFFGFHPVTEFINQRRNLMRQTTCCAALVSPIGIAIVEMSHVLICS